MAPKKTKMSLASFLGDEKLGSWADEMDSLPTAPAPKTDDGERMGGDREYGRRDRDGFSSRPDRSFPPREEIPLPTQPPYTAFVGNLSFDVGEEDLGSFFAPNDIKSVKIIKDREGKPKGFGYVEFGDLEGLKDGLSKTDSNFMSRTIRVSVAEPQKERTGGGFGGFDDEKFSGNWRRDGPLPDRNDRGGDRGDRDGGGNRRRFEGLSSEGRESQSDNNSDWRSNRPPPRFPPESSTDSGPRRRGSGFSTPTHENAPGPADTEETWSKGSRFKAAPSPTENQPGSRFGSMRGPRGDMGPPAAPSAADEGNWRRPSTSTRNSTSPSSSVPATPQRRKLELIPRAANTSAQPSPLSSPKSATYATPSTRSNPFGAAKPVDVSQREASIIEKTEKEREERVAQAGHGHHPMSRQGSRQARERGPPSDGGVRTPPSTYRGLSATASQTGSPEPEEKTGGSGTSRASAVAANVRPSFSFAKAAAGKKDSAAEAVESSDDKAGEDGKDGAVGEVAEGISEASLKD